MFRNSGTVLQNVKKVKFEKEAKSLFGSKKYLYVSAKNIVLRHVELNKGFTVILVNFFKAYSI